MKGDILHTVTYLIDARGNERAGYLLPFPPPLLARDFAQLS